MILAAERFYPCCNMAVLACSFHQLPRFFYFRKQTGLVLDRSALAFLEHYFS